MKTFQPTGRFLVALLQLREELKTEPYGGDLPINIWWSVRHHKVGGKKIKSIPNSTETVEVPFPRGRERKGSLVWSEVFLLTQKGGKKRDIEKLKPCRIKERPGNSAEEFYALQSGGKHLVLTTVIAGKVQGFLLCRVLVPQENGECKTEKAWKESLSKKSRRKLLKKIRKEGI